MFVVLTIIFWKDSLTGIVALMMMCGGDGLADIVGNRVKSFPIPWSKNKTLAGTVTVFVGGWLFSTTIVLIYLSLSLAKGNIIGLLFPITVVAFFGAIVESLPFKDVDNITVPIASILLWQLLVMG